MDKREIYRELERRGIWYEITEHEAVFSMAEMARIAVPYPEADAKNLFVRDDKRRNYYLITVRGDKRADLKAFRQQYHTRPLSFASADELQAILQLTPGSVTPMGALNDADGRVRVCIDRELLEPPGLVGVHPNDNTATVWLRTADLIGLIAAHGNAVEVVDIQSAP